MTQNPTDEVIDAKIAGVSRDVERIRRMAYYDRRHLPDLVDSLCELAKFRSRKGESDRAERLYREALTHCEESPMPVAPELIFRIHSLLGYHLDSTGKTEEAMEHYQQAIGISGRCPALEPAQIGVVHNNLAMIAKQDGRIAGAEEQYRTALRYFSKSGLEADPRVAAVHNNLGVLEYSQRKLEQSRASHEEALRIRLLVHGTDGTHTDLGQSYTNLAAVHKALGNHVAAAGYLTKVAALGTVVLVGNSLTETSRNPGGGPDSSL